MIFLKKKNDKSNNSSNTIEQNKIKSIKRDCSRTIDRGDTVINEPLFN
jgi:hypothetical protein